MVSWVVLAGVVLLFLLASGSLAFFLLFVDPEYLGLSAFAFFYLSVFGLLFSLFFIFGYVGWGRKKRAFAQALPRRAILLALLGTGSLFLEHINYLSGYTFVALCAIVMFTEYALARRL